MRSIPREEDPVLAPFACDGLVMMPMHGLQQLELDPAKVGVERNGEIVPRSTLGEAALTEGDVLGIVHFVGGG